MASYVAPLIGTAAVQGPTSKPDSAAQAATYNPDGSFEGWVTPVAADANGDVTVPGDLTVSGGSTVFGDGSQDIRLTSVCAANRLDSGLLTRIIATSGNNLFSQCYLIQQQRFVEVAWPFVPVIRHLKGADANAYVIGQGQVVSGADAGIPTTRYLTYDTLNVEIGLGVPMPHRRETSTAIREVARSTVEWIVSTDASRTGRVIHTVEDWAGSRETFREESDGSGPRIGFLGADAVARPTVTGSWSDGTAGVSLAAALASLGLITDDTTE